MSCSEPKNYYKVEDINGECPACGEPTVDGDCIWSPIECEACGNAPCNESC